MERNKRKTRIAIVNSKSGDKTICAKIERRIKDTRYKKIVKIFKKVLVHDEQNKCNVGDEIVIMETRPLSKNKHWRVAEIKKVYEDVKIVGDQAI